MNRLRSEVLFNRALIWTAISLIQNLAGNSNGAWISSAISVYDFWKSFKAWNEVDE